jgi:SAM-dependent methyltransferase
LLDLGCGAGFAAVAAAAGGVEQVLGSDVVERCLRFGRLNAALNDLPNVDFVRSDLFDDVAGDFDLIVANTPCAWEEVQQATFATGGGAFGTELPMRMLSESLENLRTDGLIVVVMAAPLIRGRPYVHAAIRRACADRPVDIHIHPLFSEYEYAHAKAYRRHGITQFVRYLIAVSPADRLSITVEPSTGLRFVSYRTRAAAVRLAARFTQRLRAG